MQTALYNSYVALSFIKHISPRYKKLPIPFDARSWSCLLQIQEGSFPANLSKRWKSDRVSIFL